MLHAITFPDGTPGTEKVTYLGTGSLPILALVRLHRNQKIVTVYVKNLR